MEFFANSDKFMSTYGDMELQEQAKNNRWRLSVKGIPAELIQQELACDGAFEGTVDVDKFAAGEGIIWLAPDSQEVMGRDFKDSVHPGDAAIIGFYDNQGNYSEKEMTVLAVCEKRSMFGTSDIRSGHSV